MFQSLYIFICKNYFKAYNLQIVKNGSVLGSFAVR